MTSILISISLFVVWIASGGLSLSILDTKNTRLFTFDDRTESAILLFILLGPLLLIDIPYTYIIDSIERFQNNKKLLKSCKFKVGDRIRQKDKHGNRGIVTNISIHNGGVFYTINNAGYNKLLSAIYAELDRKSRIENLTDLNR